VGWGTSAEDQGRGLGDNGGAVGLAGGARDGVSALGGGGRLAGGGGGADGVSTAIWGGNSAGGDGGETVALSALGDTELCGVLVLAGNVVDELETVTGHIGLEGSGWGPDERSAVGNASNDGLERNHVGGRATEKDQRDAVGGGWLPGDGEGLASRDNLDQRTSDGVTAGLANGSMLGSGEAGEESNEGGLGEHVVDDGCWYYVINA
jgi:hypothetical protein